MLGGRKKLRPPTVIEMTLGRLNAPGAFAGRRIPNAFYLVAKQQT